MNVRQDCFNGATAMKPWKRVNGPQTVAPVEVLQWGHGDEAVEEHGRLGDYDLFELASMGPRR